VKIYFYRKNNPSIRHQNVGYINTTLTMKKVKALSYVSWSLPDLQKILFFIHFKKKEKRNFYQVQLLHDTRRMFHFHYVLKIYVLFSNWKFCDAVWFLFWQLSNTDIKFWRIPWSYMLCIKFDHKIIIIIIIFINHYVRERINFWKKTKKRMISPYNSI